MAVNIQLTSIQWTALIALVIISMFPFVVAPMAGSVNGLLLGLPTWFWIVFMIGVVMYVLVIVFIKNPGSASVSQEERAPE